MTRYVWLLVLSAALFGCRAPAPSLDILAPYGSAVVPPPGTGTVGTLGNYYGAPGTGMAAPTSVPPSPASVPPQGLSPPPGAVPPTPEPVAPSGVAPASFQPAAPVSFESVQSDPLRVIAPVASAVPVDAERPTANSFTEPAHDDSNPLRLDGMPINDATVYDDVSPLPTPGAAAGSPGPTAAAGNSPAFLRFMSPKPASAAGTAAVTAVPAAPLPPPASGAWQAR